MPRGKRTRVISFRVEEELFEEVEEVRIEEKIERADFVKDIFVPAFKDRIDAVAAKRRNRENREKRRSCLAS